MSNERIYKVMVVDPDEEFLVYAAEKADWKSMGYKIIKATKNTAEAQRALEKFSPDVVVVNTQLPLMSGFEFVEQVRVSEPNLPVVFLSDDRDYGSLKQAMDHKALSYIEKPVDEEKFHQVMESVHQSLDEINSLVHMEKLKEKELALTLASLIANPYHDEIDEEEARVRLKEDGLVIEKDSKMVILTISTSKMRMPSKKTIFKINRILQKFYSCGSFALSNHIVSLLVSPDSFEALDPLLMEAGEYMSREGEWLIGVSRPFEKIENVTEATFEALDIARLSKKKGIQHYDAFAAESKESVSSEIQKAAEFDKLLISPKKEELEEYLLDQLREEASEISLLQIITVADGVFRYTMSKAKADQLLKEFNLYSLCTSSMDMGILRHQIMDYCLAGNEMVRREKQKDMKILVSQVMRAIETRYKEPNLTLQSLSEMLRVTPNYLSSQIRKYQGNTFVNMLIKKRMEVAKELLKDEDLKISDIAELTGYADQHYFSNSFRKFYQISPLQMRRRLLEEEK